VCEGHTWKLTNTPDTEPPVFEWADQGAIEAGRPGSSGKGRAIGFDDDGNLSVNGLTAGGWTLKVV
jgi:hypothetical protein